MGTGASSGLQASISSNSHEDLTKMCETLPADTRARLVKTLEHDSTASSPPSEEFENVKGLRDATRVGAGMYWDFANSRATKGRTWHQHSPEHMREQLCRDITDEERQACREATRIDQIQPAPEGTSPEVLIIIGPSGAGKSMALPKAAAKFGFDMSKFAHVDGDHMRARHTAWKTLVAEDQANGYFDAYDIYITNKGNKGLKRSFTKECLTARKNVVFPWTSIEQTALDMIKEKGYNVTILGLMISCAESDCRQKNRAETNGRWSTTPEDKWLVTADHLSILCQPSNSSRVLVFDSTDVMNMRVVCARGISGIDDTNDLEATIEKLKLDNTI